MTEGQLKVKERVDGWVKQKSKKTDAQKAGQKEDHLDGRTARRTGSNTEAWKYARGRWTRTRVDVVSGPKHNIFRPE